MLDHSSVTKHHSTWESDNEASPLLAPVQASTHTKSSTTSPKSQTSVSVFDLLSSVSFVSSHSVTSKIASLFFGPSDSSSSSSITSSPALTMSQLAHTTHNLDEPLHANHSQQHSEHYGDDHHQHEEEEPVDDPAGKAGNVATFMSIVKANVGSGCLSLPFAFKQTGWLLGSITMLALFPICMICMYQLMEVADKLKKKYGSSKVQTYGDVAQLTLGSWGKKTVDAFLVGTQLGFASVYFIFISDNVYAILNSYYGTTNPNKREWMVIIFPVMLALSLIRRLSKLGIFVTLATIVLFICTGLVYVVEIMLPLQFINIKLVDWSGWPIFIGIAIYSFEGIGVVLPIRNNCKDPKSFKLVLTLAMSVVCLIYLSFGVLGYLTFGAATCSSVTLNMKSTVATVVKLSLCFTLFASYPLQVFPISEMFDNIFFFDKIRKSQATHSDDEHLMDGHQHLPHEAHDGHSADKTPPINGEAASHPQAPWLSLSEYQIPNLSLKRHFVRLCLCIATLVFAVSVPSFGLFISVIGALGGSMLALVLPPLFKLSLERDYFKRLHAANHSSHGDIEQIVPHDGVHVEDDSLAEDHDLVLSKYQRVQNWFIFFIGLAAMVYGTVSSIQAIVDAFEKGDISPDPKPSSDGKYFTCFD